MAMSDKPFVHLHCPTDYSLLDGACEISAANTNLSRRHPMNAAAGSTDNC
jgi:DNA polymerase III alpha subunit